jgi:hypothetical protein
MSRQSSVIDDADLNDIEFGFDRDLFSSKPYLSVARSRMWQSIMSRRKQTSSTTIMAAPPPQLNENDSVISDTSTLVVANDDGLDVMTDPPITMFYLNTTPLPAIPEQTSKTNEKKNKGGGTKPPWKMPLRYGIPLVPGSIRMRTYAQTARRLAPPQQRE